MTWLLYPLICTALYYLGYHALITSWIWTRYPSRLDDFMRCAACSGFWYGLLCGAVGAWYNIPFMGFPARDPITVIGVGLCSIVWTPILANRHLTDLAMTGAEPEGHSSSSAPSSSADGG